MLSIKMCYLIIFFVVHVVVILLNPESGIRRGIFLSGVQILSLFDGIQESVECWIDVFTVLEVMECRQGSLNSSELKREFTRP